MSPRTYTLRRIGLGSLFRWGLVGGVVVACLPGLVCSTVLFSVARSLGDLLASWRDVGITVLGQRVALNLIDLLHLNDFYNLLLQLAGFGVFGILLLTILLALALGIFSGVVLLLLGLFYNLTGRIDVELAAAERQQDGKT